MSNPRVTKLRYIGLAGPDFATERGFLQEPWGLREVARDGELAYFRAEGSSEPYVTRLRGAEKRGLDLMGFAATDKAAVDALGRNLARDGVKMISEPRRLDSPGGGYGFRCFDLDGHALEISADATPGEARELKRGESIPSELSHIVLHTPDIKSPSTRRIWASASATGWAISCASCAATRCITASPSCRGRRRSTMSLMRCATSMR
jgi:hypothetical protein